MSTDPLKAESVVASSDNPFPECFHEKMGESEVRGLSDHFGLTQFGFNLEVIKPNGSSGLTHWHTESDEFVYVIEGELELQIGSKITTLTVGQCVGFKGGNKVGHRLINRTNSDAKFLVVGSRIDGDKAVYTDDDFQWLVEADGTWVPANKMGEAY